MKEEGKKVQFEYVVVNDPCSPKICYVDENSFKKKLTDGDTVFVMIGISKGRGNVNFEYFLCSEDRKLKLIPKWDSSCLSDCDRNAFVEDNGNTLHCTKDNNFTPPEGSIRVH